MSIPYRHPEHWLQYIRNDVMDALVDAKASILAVTQLPSQRSWADRLQALQLRMEVAGTSRIEGAEFTDQELDSALDKSAEDLATRSQKQAAAAGATYRWIATLPRDSVLSEDMIREVHRRIVTGCDDDHCVPGDFRKRNENVLFGVPRHRGVEGGTECEEAVAGLLKAASTEFGTHDPLLQALAVHYHIAAMHPFLDGNGRTARAAEAFMLRHAGLTDTTFIAMSNYYHDEKAAYLAALAEVRHGQNDLTPFFQFALKGITRQCRMLLGEIRRNIAKALFRDTMRDLFTRLKSPKRRVVSKRQLEVANLLLDKGPMEFQDLIKATAYLYTLRSPRSALIRDLNNLLQFQAFTLDERVMPDGAPLQQWLDVDLDWPTKVSDTDFFRYARALPKGKTLGFLANA